jgi:hypothetical protein
MKNPAKLVHLLFFAVTLVWLCTSLYYQVPSDFRYFRFTDLWSKPQVLASPADMLVDEAKIKVICDPTCFFVIGNNRVRSRTDSDAGGGLAKVSLRFFDPHRELIGYEDDHVYPNFFVIDTRGELLQVVRLRLEKVSFAFEAYYPDSQLIEFRRSDGKKFLFSANKPELISL